MLLRSRHSFGRGSRAGTRRAARPVLATVTGWSTGRTGGKGVERCRRAAKEARLEPNSSELDAVRRPPDDPSPEQGDATDQKNGGMS